jgi:hypothetical protein
MAHLIQNLPRLLRTLRHLKPVQVWGRVRLRLYRPRVEVRPAPALRMARARWCGCSRMSSMAEPVCFRFLNIEHTLESAADWNRADWPRLWLYNMHYFDDLAADAALARTAWHRELIGEWIADNPPPSRPGWEPYPTSLRIVNWIKWVLAGNTPDPEALHSLAIQVRWLRKHLEFHLLGNHLWANAKALVFAGAFFEGDEASRWLQRGMALLRRELAEQILPDGGHFERSPMYHAIVAEDLLDLVQLAALFPERFDATEVQAWRKTAMRMLRWLRVMTHPDGGIALFNDAASGIAPDNAALARYAARLGVTVDAAPLQAIEALPDSGYVRLQQGNAVLIADVGEIGPDYLPGHAHADTLSFELSLNGQRVFVNGGTSTYDATPERVRQRGTAAHNTVVIDGKDSSEVWAAFRAGRRARPLDVAYGETDEGAWLRAAHDGYQHLPGSPVHHREWRLSPHGLTVNDAVDGNCEHAEARYRLAPHWRAEGDGASIISLVIPESRSDIRDPVSSCAREASDRHWVPASAGMTKNSDGDGFRDPRSGDVPPDTRNGAMALRWQSRPPARIVASTYHPGFSLAEPCRLIAVPLDGKGASFFVEWN